MRSSRIPQRPVVLALDTSWFSRHGGITTFNRHLCRYLAAAGAHVFCAVQEPTVREQDDARTAAVALVHWEDEEAPKLSLPDGVVPDAIIGHGRVTGPVARRLRSQHYLTAKLLHVVHTAPDEIEWHKTGRSGDAGMRAEQRMRMEVRLAADADQVFTVGPRLRDLYVKYLATIAGAPEPQEINPGFDGQEVIAHRAPPGRPREVLVLGRLEDATIKGIDVAARGLAYALDHLDAQENEVALLLRGVPADEHQALYEQVNTCSGRRFPLVTRSFTTNAEDLRADLLRATLLPMPSRAEAYGLVAAEAIAHGTPVLISERSGLAQFLREHLPGEQHRRLVVPVVDDEQRDAITWGEAIMMVLQDATAAFARAAQLRQTLAHQQTWAMAAETVLGRLRPLGQAGAVPRHKLNATTGRSDVVGAVTGHAGSEPAYCAIVFVDIEGFGARPNPVQLQVRADLYTVVDSALIKAGFDRARIVQEDRGDGMLLIDRDMKVLELVGRFIRELDDALRLKARTSAPIARIRLRVAVHHGMCEYDGNGWVGTAINTAARLVDAQRLRDVLAAADKANLALIVSTQVFDEVIRQEYCSIDSSPFEQVAIDAKELRGAQAWIRVPGCSYPPKVKPTAKPGSQPASAKPAVTKPKGKKDRYQQGGIVFESEVVVQGDIVHTKNVKEHR